MKLIDFSQTFKDEDSCRAHLRSLREKEGVLCSKCGCKHQYWDKYNKCWICSECGHKTTLTSGTMFHGSKLPLMYWFTAIHLLTSTKKTFSALEIQRQLGHKRYQPIWEMVHKIRSVMGLRDEKYKVVGTAEIDEAFFTAEKEPEEKDQPQKRGAGSQRKAKVLVMVESEEVTQEKKYKKNRVCGHLKMKVLEDLQADTITGKVKEMADEKTELISDASSSHAGLDEAVAKVTKQAVKPKDGHKVLPWVHTAISNAKSLFLDMYHGVKKEFLQYYLDEFCYKFNRRKFDDRVFDRVLIAAVGFRPAFVHRPYRKQSPLNG